MSRTMKSYICDSFYVRVPPAVTTPFSFDEPLPTDIYTLSLHDALPIYFLVLARYMQILSNEFVNQYSNRIINIHHRSEEHTSELSHVAISYAVFCLKKKKSNSVTRIRISR